jgi:hypothetical protein
VWGSAPSWLLCGRGKAAYLCDGVQCRVGLFAGLHQIHHLAAGGDFALLRYDVEGETGGEFGGGEGGGLVCGGAGAEFGRVVPVEGGAGYAGGYGGDGEEYEREDRKGGWHDAGGGGLGVG